jgi:FkbM family methyltransferase
MKIKQIVTELGNGRELQILGYDVFTDYYRKCELQTKRWILRHLNKDSIFVDVGANIGIISLTALEIIKSGKVLAIEPTTTFDILSKNISESEVVVLCNAAISDFDGVATANLAKIWGYENVEQDFNFRKLDSIWKEYSIGKVDCLKIDTDGWELEVLKGAANLINESRPSIIVELNEALAVNQHTIQEVFNLLIDYKYTHALICDGANYIFTSNWEMGDPWPHSIAITSDREPINSNFELGAPLQTINNIFAQEKDTEFDVDHDSKVVFTSNKGQWAYAFSYRASIQYPLINLGIRITGKLIKGALGILVTNFDGDKPLSNEVVISRIGFFDEIIFTSSWDERLVFRQVSEGEINAEIEKICFFQAVPKELGESSTSQNLSRYISIVEVSEFMSRWEPNHESNVNIPGQNGWLQEQISAHALKSIVSLANPKKFFEFGTWEGFTSLLVLKTTDAEVWSINDVEYLKDGQYTSRYFDFFDQNYSFITGHLVDKTEYVNRYHQIIGDSLSYDFTSFDGFFDFIYIDGGHDKVTVSNDSLKAIKMLKEKGNIIIWDDFQIDQNYRKLGSQSLEVYESIEILLPKLSAFFDFFFLKGTQLLVGIKK